MSTAQDHPVSKSPVVVQRMENHEPLGMQLSAFPVVARHVVRWAVQETGLHDSATHGEAENQQHAPDCDSSSQCSCSGKLARGNVSKDSNMLEQPDRGCQHERQPGWRSV